tara:strand:+ start:18907 stop:19554 length:648 start_codon:yes stop_codon:yes gene_type:complete
MSFTFAELKTAIQDYTENSETTFVNNLSLFIKNAEQRIHESVQLEFFRRNVTTNMTIGQRFVAMPGDYLASYSMSITNSGSKVFLDSKDVNYLEDFTPNSSTTGTPRYYAAFSSSDFIVAPTPDAAYQVELHYFYRPASLTAGADSGTTWLSSNAPFAMLYGSLIEAYTFMKGEADILQNYDQKFMQALSRLKDLGEAKQTGDAYREGLLTRPKT